jgi:hypothetical protein
LTPQHSGTETRDLPAIALRTVTDADLDALFDLMRDPESVWMAAFTPDDPDDRPAFDAHMARPHQIADLVRGTASTRPQLRHADHATSQPDCR